MAGRASSLSEGRRVDRFWPFAAVMAVQFKGACHRTTARRAMRRKRRAPEAGR